jgi:hypothetical protein
MLLVDDVIGDQEDWAQFITLADEHTKPLLSLIPKGKKPVSRLYNYQAEVYATPAKSNMPEGKDWDTFKSAGQNRVELQARVERFDETAAVSVMAEELGNAAGIDSELAHEIVKKTEEMARCIECKLGSDDPAYVDDGVTQDRTQGMGLWIQSGTTSQVYATPAAVRPDAGQIYTGTKANLFENAVRDVLQAQWTKTGGTGTHQLVVGSELKERFSNFTLYIPSDVSTQTTSLVTNRNMNDRSLQRIVDRYNSEFGSYELHLSNWLAQTGWGAATASVGQWRGYALNTDMWELRWHTKPQWHRPEFKGGSYKAACYAILMLVCKNPIGEAAIKPSDA